MSWIKLDDSFADHPKVVTAGPIAAIIQIRALCYAARHLTDGHIPFDIYPSLLTGFAHIGIATGGVPGMAEVGCDIEEIDWAKVLLEAGLWEQNHDGYLIHDYLKYNPSKAEILELRKMKAKAGQAGGKASAQARAQPPAQPPAKPLLSPFGSEVLNSPSPSPKEREKKDPIPKEASARASATDQNPFAKFVSDAYLRSLLGSPEYAQVFGGLSGCQLVLKQAYAFLDAHPDLTPDPTFFQRFFDEARYQRVKQNS